MDLFHYIASLRIDKDFPTPRKLEITSDGLVKTLRSLITRSEAEGIELGLNLYWDPTSSSIATSDEFRGIGPAAVDMHARDVHKDINYLGDCHTHPYDIKMGPAATIGPSNSDYMEWWIFPPVPAKAALDETTPEFMAIHIVLSVSAVFLVLCRTQTATKVAFGTFVDTDRLQEPMRDIDIAEKFSKAKSGKTVVDQHRGERKFWDENFPTMARDFAQDNLTFNLGQARLLGFEYYIGKIEAAEPWNLELRSQPIKIGRSTALTCIKCNSVHGYAPGIINLWHRCTACGAVYCPSCGKNTLRRPSTFSRTRVCDRIACSGETALVS
ncbi:MAG: hypothetical protein SFX72_16685 [Isosphaeraceae bacterium]|nr:hypothetical protein [Isosphaeraceae bacterium]